LLKLEKKFKFKKFKNYPLTELKTVRERYRRNKHTNFYDSRHASYDHFYDTYRQLDDYNLSELPDSDYTITTG